MNFDFLIAAFCTASLLSACRGEPETRISLKCMDVKVSAYNSLPYQTRPGTPGNITAWGDTLNTDVPSVAVSRDLIDSGFVYGSRVLIEGFTDTFVVNDKMNRRYKTTIDVFMGKDVDRALEFGRKRLNICLIDTISTLPS
ncbi:MAG TPA: hypothetical protein VKY29_04160 [Cryomorphaceae bacterium]|nr:hypothetical protein [Cryomorphaceae bacterium]